MKIVLPPINDVVLDTTGKLVRTFAQWLSNLAIEINNKFTNENELKLKIISDSDLNATIPVSSSDPPLSITSNGAAAFYVDTDDNKIYWVLRYDNGATVTYKKVELI